MRWSLRPPKHMSEEWRSGGVEEGENLRQIDFLGREPGAREPRGLETEARPAMGAQAFEGAEPGGPTDPVSAPTCSSPHRRAVRHSRFTDCETPRLS